MLSFENNFKCISATFQTFYKQLRSCCYFLKMLLFGRAEKSLNCQTSFSTFRVQKLQKEEIIAQLQRVNPCPFLYLFRDFSTYASLLKMSKLKINCIIPIKTGQKSVPHIFKFILVPLASKLVNYSRHIESLKNVL